MYFPDRGCVHTLLTLYVYATAAEWEQRYETAFSVFRDIGWSANKKSELNK